MKALAEIDSNLGPHARYPTSVKAGIPRLSSSNSDWQVVSIGELFIVKIRAVKLLDEELYSLVTVKRSRGGVIRREKLKGKNIAVKSQFYIKNGDFLISKRQIVHGACGFVPNELHNSIVSNEYSVLNCSDKILPEFLNQLMHTNYFQQTCFHSSLGVHIEKMIFKLDNWFKWKIKIPNIKQQQKITNFLTALDQRINLLKQKKAGLETYKKGLMQKIFNQEIRFKDENGDDYPDWKEKRLGDVCNIKMGTSPKSAAYNNENYGLPLIQGNADIKDRQSVPRVFTSEITKECFPNELLLSVRAPVGEVSKSNHHACIGRGMSAISSQKGTVIEFIFQYLLWFEPRWKSISQGSTFESVNTKDITGLKLNLPSKEEQQKIADCLSSMDQSINKLKKQIEQTTQFKKGLLQKMFV